jgi:LmbE family N-acetylglucosaminyl deacetylase
MQRLIFDRPASDPFRVLCIGAHSDDIEIGCAGLLLKLMAGYPSLSCHWVVLGAKDERRAEEARTSAEVFLRPAKEREIIVKGFRDSFFPYTGVEIKEYFETLKGIQPDLILTHARHDLHQDHRVVCELTHNTFRNHAIFEYEVPKYDGDLGAPNVFAGLDRGLCEQKVSHLRDHFGSQKNRQWFDDETFWALLRLRGVESNSASGYAEGFYCRKVLL